MPTPRTILLALPGVVSRRLAAREGFFTAGRMFALLDEESLLLRLPARTSHELLERAPARSLVAETVPTALPWIEVPVGMHDGELERLAAASHEAVRLLRRRSSRSSRRHRRTRGAA